MQSNLAYQEEYKEEILNGELVLMSPCPSANHNRISNNISSIFYTYLRGKPCEMFSEVMDVYLSDEDIVKPDVMIVCNPEIVKSNGIHGAPDLIVEILSPSTAKRDRGYKKDLYERSGVKEYWLVNPADKSIEVYLLKDGKYVLDNIYTLYPDDELEYMKPEEIAEIPKEFKCSLYDDLIISVKDVFDRTF